MNKNLLIYSLCAICVLLISTPILQMSFGQPATPGTAPSMPTGRFTITASDTRVPGSQFVMTVNSTTQLKDVLDTLVRNSLATTPGGTAPSMAPSVQQVITSNVNQLFNAAVQQRATSPISLGPGGGSCASVAFLHVCIG